MGLRTNVANWLTRADPQITLNQYLAMLNYQGNLYPLAGLNQSLPGSKEEAIEHTFGGYVQQAYRNNGVVFACMLVRMLLFSEARFQYQQMVKGRPGDLWSDQSLDILEHPWPGGTTGDLLSKMIQFADLSGNAFAVRRGNEVRLLRPDWVHIVLGSETDSSVDSIDIDATVLGYIYFPGGPQSGKKQENLLRDEVAHFAPIPDPLARYRGMSWLTPIVREIMGDSAASSHKLRFFENGATPNLVVKNPANLTPDKFQEWVNKFKGAEPTGVAAYKTMFLDSGVDATVVGANLRQMDFKTVQGAGETRIAAAAGVPPVIVGLSEGLQAATYSNYGQARRRLADGTMSPLWRNVAGSLETIVPPPSGSRLWTDTRDIPFLREDLKDLADVHALETQQIRTLTDAGYTPESILKAVTSGDFTRLVHSGLYSVQLQAQSASITALTNAGWEADAAIDAVVKNDLELLKGKHTGLFSANLQAPGSVKMPAGEVPGMTPVTGGTKPLVLPAGDTSTKPVTTGTTKPTNGKPVAPKRALLAPLLKEK